MSASHPFCEPRRPEFNLDPGLEGLMHSHYTLTNQRAKDSVLALAQPSSTELGFNIAKYQ